MADIIINSVTYDGTPVSPTNPFRVDADGGIQVEVLGAKLLEAADQTANLMVRGFKHQWALKWSKCNAATSAAVRAVAELTTTFPFQDQLGGSYTCIAVPGSYRSSSAFNTAANAILYNVEIGIREQ